MKHSIKSLNEVSATIKLKKELTVVVPAAGVGARFASGQPKQYAKIDQKTILAHTLDVLLSHPAIGQVMLVLHPEDTIWEDKPEIKTTIGGETRAHSVFNGLQALEKMGDEDWILVHDACRPCVSHQDIDRLIEAVADDAVGGLLARQISETVKYVEGGRAQKTVERDGLWRAQTPQMFRYALLKDALVKAIVENYNVTDEASAIEFMGQKPIVVPGSATNIKITYPADLHTAKFYLEYS